MEKLSVLIFSKDDVEQALGLIRSVHDVADEIVLMDASNAKQRAWIAGQKRELGLDKLKIHRIVALGYREPLMMYALKKCRNSWVAALNTDERFSNGLKGDVLRLINENAHVAYSIALYSVHGPRDRSFVSYQVRLFRKESVEFRGLLHERPIVRGSYAVLTEPDYSIEHMTTGMVHSAKDSYVAMERFERFTYAQHNMRLVEQVDRARRMPREEGLTVGKKLMLGLLKIYEALGFKPQQQEVSNFDYYIFWLLRNAAHQARRRSLHGVLAAFPGASAYIREMRRWRRSASGDEDFEIAQIIHNVGVTRFLGLDSEKTVDALNREHMNGKQGVGLLIDLLHKKYEALDEKTRKAYIS